MRTRQYFVFASWIGQTIHEQKQNMAYCGLVLCSRTVRLRGRCASYLSIYFAKYGLMRIDPNIQPNGSKNYALLWHKEETRSVLANDQKNRRDLPERKKPRYLCPNLR